MKELDELKNILDKDEEVKVSFKPNQKRFVFLNLIISVPFLLLFFGIFFGVGLAGLLGIMAFEGGNGGGIFMLIPSVIILIIIISTIVGTAVRYKRTIYVITNKRIIIRSGFIGVDYKSLELKNISMVNVRMDFMDKLVKPNTGTIFFGSASTPVYSGGNNNQSTSQFTFSHVENPYEVYRVCKEHIDASKEEK